MVQDVEVGRAADAEAALSASPTAPVVAALPGNDQPRITSGPLWVEGSIYDGFAAAVVGRVEVPGHADKETRTLAHVRSLADALLFASAPELLQATLGCIGLLATDPRYEGSECLELARAAVAKAIGQASA